MAPIKLTVVDDLQSIIYIHAILGLIIEMLWCYVWGDLGWPVRSIYEMLWWYVWGDLGWPVRSIYEMLWCYVWGDSGWPVRSIYEILWCYVWGDSGWPVRSIYEMLWCYVWSDSGWPWESWTTLSVDGQSMCAAYLWQCCFLIGLPNVLQAHNPVIPITPSLPYLLSMHLLSCTTFPPTNSALLQ